MRKSNDLLPAHFVLVIDSDGLSALKVRQSLAPRPPPSTAQPAPSLHLRKEAEMVSQLKDNSQKSIELPIELAHSSQPLPQSSLPPPPPPPMKAAPKRERAVALKADSETLLSDSKEEFKLDESGPLIVIGHIKLSLTLEQNALYIESGAMIVPPLALIFIFSHVFLFF